VEVVPGNGRARDPSDGAEDEDQDEDHGPSGPFVLHRVALRWHPRGVSRAVHSDLDEAGHQDGEHRQGGQVLPADQPVEAWPLSRHHLDVVGESAQNSICTK
jgi:hypothetical protein